MTFRISSAKAKREKNENESKQNFVQDYDKSLYIDVRCAEKSHSSVQGLINWVTNVLDSSSQLTDWITDLCFEFHEIVSSPYI